MASKDATKPDFTSLLETKFRWPMSNDELVKKADIWQRNAYIDQFGHGRLYGMISGYKKAADILVSHTRQNHHDSDFLVFPIIFSYRQFIELSLKALIASYGPSMGIEAIWNGHQLTAIWQKLLLVMEKYGVEDPDGTDKAVDAIIMEFDKLDSRSFNFRYPVDTKGSLVNLQFTEVDLDNLADVMCGLEGYFSGCDGYLDHLKSAGP